MNGQDRTADERSIGRLIAALEDAWARADAKAYASRFARDGTFANVLGMYFCGHEAFRERHETVFKTVFKGSTLTLRIATLRFVRPDVAIADLDAELRGCTSLPDGLPAMPEGTVRTRLLMVLVKEDGDWWISAYHNVPRSYRHRRRLELPARKRHIAANEERGPFRRHGGCELKADARP